MAVVSPGTTVTDVAAVYTTTAGVITDAQRSAALAWGTGQQGGSTDGLTPPAGIGIWLAATNLHPHGQCDTNGNYLPAGAAGSTIGNPDTGTPFTITPQTIPVVCDGTNADQGVSAQSNAGQAAAAGTVGACSIRFKGKAGNSYRAFISWQNTDSSLTSGTVTAFTATGAEQTITPATLAVAAGETGDVLMIVVQTNALSVETFHVGCPMLQSGVNAVSPYVATSDGATAARVAGRVRAPASLLDETTSWEAWRVMLGDVTDVSYMGRWGDDNSNQLYTRYSSPGSRWETLRQAAGVATQCVVNAVQAVGDVVTVVRACDSAGIKLSINGAAFTSAVGANIPTLAATLYDIASNNGGTQLNGNLYWYACGIGTLTDSDAAALAALPNAMPSLFPPALASLTGRAFAYSPVGPKFRRVRVGEPVVTTD